jgi:hypothetical protein
MERPRIDLPRTHLQRVWEVISICSLAAVIVLTLLRMGQFPESVPSHFSAGGEPDRFALGDVMWILPLLSVAVYAGLSWLQRIPHRFNYPVAITPENARSQYANAVGLVRILKVVILGQLASLTFFQQQVALGIAESLPGWWLPVSVVCVVVALIAYLVRAFQLG